MHEPINIGELVRLEPSLTGDWPSWLQSEELTDVLGIVVDADQQLTTNDTALVMWNNGTLSVHLISKLVRINRKRSAKKRVKNE